METLEQERDRYRSALIEIEERPAFALGIARVALGRRDVIKPAPVVQGEIDVMAEDVQP